ncbi:hypothetical protein D9M68_123320 [compost metagenome]
MAQLTEDMITAGGNLVRELDLEKVTINVALWLLNEEADQWNLVLAMPKVRQIGPRKTYLLIGKAVSKLNRREVTMSNVVAVDQTDPLPRAVRSAIGTGPSPALARIRVTSSMFNGIAIPDALIYRSR